MRDYRATRPGRANEFRLGQVLLNLLLNAADAIPEGAVGRHTITLRTYSDDERVFAEVKTVDEITAMLEGIKG